MSARTFRAVCSKDHPDIHFMDPDEFVKHMRTEHHRRTYARPAVANPTPRPWVAPKAPTSTDKLSEILAGNARQGEISDWETESKVAVDLLAVGDIFVLGHLNGVVKYEVAEVDREGRGLLITMLRNPANPEPKTGWLKKFVINGEAVTHVYRVGRAKPARTNADTLAANLAALAA